MKEPIYNLFDSKSGFPYIMILFFFIGVGILVYCFCVIGKEQAEYDGQPVLIKDLPLWSRMIIQGLPTLIGIALILFSCINMLSFHMFYAECRSSDYVEVSGEIENVHIERADTRTEEQYEITFSNLAQKAKLTGKPLKALKMLATGTTYFINSFIKPLTRKQGESWSKAVKRWLK